MRKILSILLLAVLLAGCTQTTESAVTELTESTQPETIVPAVTTPPPETKPMEILLLGEAGSLEEAQALAELYGITLVDYKNGIGRFYTEEDPREVIQRGVENGWPELGINGINYPF